MKTMIPLLSLSLATAAFAQVQPVNVEDFHHAPPQPPPALIRSVPDEPPASASAASLTLYSIGEPTDEEQLYLEYINRARANPPEEGIRLRDTTDPQVLSAYSGVDLNMMVSEFNAIAAAPPLSMNSNLTHAARLHSQDMLANAFQGHTGSDSSSPSQRVTNAGYNWSTVAENVYAYAKSVFYGHAGFNVDWGPGPGGMQTGRGHRANIHSANYREVGIGNVLGSNGPVGPQLVTQNFGSRFGLTPFITGVVFYDLNGNDFYDLGEGIGGVTVTVSGASHYAVTANSGGYSVPVPGNGVYTVAFSAPDMAMFETIVTVSGGNNVKVDHAPVYSPAISGPVNPIIGQPNAYSINLVGAATAYRWKQARNVPFAEIEGAENGEIHITSQTSGYSLIVSDSKASGTYSFRMVHPELALQWFKLDRSLRVNSASHLQFSSRLGNAGDGQIARAEISIDQGATWETVWSQTGSNSSGESGFTPRAISLAAFDGSEIQVRFAYAFVGGSYYPQTSPGVGFYVDDITVTNAEELLDPIVTDVGTAAFEFNPSQAGTYVLQASAEVSGRFLPQGPALVVTAMEAPPEVQITGIADLGSGQVQIEFDVAGTLAGNFELQYAAELGGSWSADAAASFQTMVPGSQYRATTAAAGSQRYYRIRVLP